VTMAVVQYSQKRTRSKAMLAPMFDVCFLSMVRTLPARKRSQGIRGSGKKDHNGPGGVSLNQEV